VPPDLAQGQAAVDADRRRAAKFNGVYIGSQLDFQRELYLAGIGATVELEMFRAGGPFPLELVIAERPEEAITR
jgi:S1-C subfamily serine protease